MEQAGSDTAMAAKDAYHGTGACRQGHDDHRRGQDRVGARQGMSARSAIHVTTTAGVVTLKGNVRSPEMAQHAAQIAEQTNGVKSVNNQLMVLSSASTD